MLNEDFFISLEHSIGRALADSPTEETKGFWCDGVIALEPDSHYTTKYVNDNRAIRLRAFIDKDGQGEYDLIVHFGPKALSRYARGLSIQECIPNTAEENWFRIDTNSKRIEVQLA